MRLFHQLNNRKKFNIEKYRTATYESRNYRDKTLVILAKYGRMKRGDSIMPTKILAAIPKPAAPPTRRVFCKHHEKMRMTNGNIRQ